MVGVRCHLPNEIVRPTNHFRGWAHGLAFDGQSLWTVAEYYDETTSGPGQPSFHFYRLNL